MSNDSKSGQSKGVDRMPDPEYIADAREMAEAHRASDDRLHRPNESDEYRAARTALLAEEIELRRHIARVAAQRRSLPPGGEVPRDYEFVGVDGPVSMSELFGDHDTLITYSFMYGPDREEACPMCTSQLDAWDGNAANIEQRAAFVMIARSPIERIKAWADSRGWKHLRLVSDTSGDYTRAYVSADDADMPGYNVFSRADGTVRHFWSGEGGSETADPQEDPATHPTWRLSGPFSTPRLRAGAPTGTRRSATPGADFELPRLRSCQAQELMASRWVISDSSADRSNGLPTITMTWLAPAST